VTMLFVSFVIFKCYTTERVIINYMFFSHDELVYL